jgi:hypothetical protein
MSFVSQVLFLTGCCHRSLCPVRFANHIGIPKMKRCGGCDVLVESFVIICSSTLIYTNQKYQFKKKFFFMRFARFSKIYKNEFEFSRLKVYCVFVTLIHVLSEVLLLEDGVDAPVCRTLC